MLRERERDRTALAARVAAALDRPPLSEIGAPARAELAAAVAAADSFEDLPGKWQAAILTAEAGASPAPGGCCGG